MRTAPAPAQRRALAAFVALRRAASHFDHSLAPSLDEQGLTMTQFAVLEALLHLGPLSQKRIGDRILRSESNMTTVMSNLERDGLVKRREDPADGRVRLVHLTRSGRALIQRAFPLHAEELTQQMSTLTAREVDQLRHLCRKLAGGSRAEQEATS